MIENNNDEVLILGLPNSGKSTLVNVLTSKKVSIIGSTPNTTRDKVSTIAEINNKKVVISDLPGYLENPDELILSCFEGGFAIEKYGLTPSLMKPKIINKEVEKLEQAYQKKNWESVNETIKKLNSEFDKNNK